MHKLADGTTVGWAVSDEAIAFQRGDIWTYNGKQWVPRFDYEYRLNRIINLPAGQGAARAWAVGEQVILHSVDTWSTGAAPAIIPRGYIPYVAR
jgi:hypothetical protein